MGSSAPKLAVVAGPNSAGKSTIAPALLRDLFGIREFVNADVIAQGMSAFDLEAVAIAAARTMLRRLHELADAGADFAFETTLASRSFAPWIAQLRSRRGYSFHLAFIWIPAPELAVERVHRRVAAGGHHVPDDVVQRRFDRGLRNSFELYRPLADRWLVYDNSDRAPPRLIAQGCADEHIEVLDERSWERMRRPDVIRERAPTRHLFDDTEAINRAVARGVREAIRRHKLLGQSICVWEDGRVVVIEPDDIVVPPEIPPEPR